MSFLVDRVVWNYMEIHRRLYRIHLWNFIFNETPRNTVDGIPRKCKQLQMSMEFYGIGNNDSQPNTSISIEIMDVM